MDGAESPAVEESGSHDESKGLTYLISSRDVINIFFYIEAKPSDSNLDNVKSQDGRSTGAQTPPTGRPPFLLERIRD
jgi:hypothetical protein